MPDDLIKPVPPFPWLLLELIAFTLAFVFVNTGQEAKAIFWLLASFYFEFKQLEPRLLGRKP